MVIMIESTASSSATFRPDYAALPTNLLRRDRVDARLSQALRMPLTVVAAPAGSGKSTALRAWLEASPIPYAWLQIDEEDDEVDAFVRHLIAAMQLHCPAFGRTTLAALAGTATPAMSMLATDLVAELAEMTGDFILVVDDYHVIRNSGVHELMRRVVTRLPDSVHLVAASRTAPPWPLARLRALDRVADIGSADLSFPPDEATALVELTAGRTLDPDAAVLLARAEGWALGLRLLGIALRDCPDVSVVASRLHGDSNRDLLQYFLEEVLTRQSAAAQAGLLASSILDRFTPELCSVVIGDDPAWRDCGALDWAEQDDIFLIALDDEPGWYRRHPMCREALRHELQKRHGPATVARLHRRASAWFADQGMIEEAIRHALAAGETPAAVRLVEQHAVRLILTEDWLELEVWLDLLPADALSGNSWLLACRAWTLWQRQDFDRIPSLLERAEELLPQLGTAPDGLPASTVQAAVETLWAAHHLIVGTPQQALKRAARAHEVVGGAEDPLYGWVICHEGVALQFAGHHERALAVLNGALAEGTRLGRSLVIVHALLGLTVVHYMGGRLYEVEALATRLLELHEAADRVVGAGWAHYWLGMVYYEWNQRDQARDHFGWVVARRHLANHRVLRDSILATAMLDHVEGRIAASETLLAGLEGLALNTENYSILQQIDVFRALLAMTRGEAAEAEQQLALMATSLEQGGLAFLPAPQLIGARALLARGGAEAATRTLAALTELQHAAESCGHRRRLVETLAVQALAHERLGQSAEALEQLTRALELAEPGGFVRTFVDLGSDLARLLGVLWRQRVAAGYISRLLGEFVASPAYRSPTSEAAARRARAQGQLVEPLTDRELAVVNLLGQRLSYAEIAAELTIAPSTVKTHVNHIYGKLGANGRKDAIITADRLGLMDAVSV